MRPFFTSTLWLWNEPTTMISFHDGLSEYEGLDFDFRSLLGVHGTYEIRRVFASCED